MRKYFCVSPKLKEMIANIKVGQAREDITKALDQMNKEIVRHSSALKYGIRRRPRPKENEAPGPRRDSHLAQGIISLFSGAGLMIFLYFLGAAIVLKLPPDVLAKIPFELGPVVRIFWLVGLIPALAGLGHLTAAALIGRPRARSVDTPEQPPLTLGPQPTAQVAPGSITEHTTVALDRKAPLR